jgi:hypothetical protein
VPVIVKVETDNLIRSFKGRASLVVAALADEGQIGRTGRSSARLPAPRPGIAYAAGHSGSGRRPRRATPTWQGRCMRLLGAEVIRPATTSTPPVKPPTARRPGGGHLVIDGDDPRIAAGADDGGRADRGDCRRAPGRHRRRPGRKRRPDQRDRLGPAAAPDCRIVGIWPGGRRDDALPMGGRAIDTPTVATYATASPRGWRSRRRSHPAASTMRPSRTPRSNRAGQLTAELGYCGGPAAASWAGSSPGRVPMDLPS